ncbi:MAG: hypothetical protein ACRDRP_12655 [Pseudonocardiaceae bacterium]
MPPGYHAREQHCAGRYGVVAGQGFGNRPPLRNAALPQLKVAPLGTHLGRAGHVAAPRLRLGFALVR